MMTGTASTMPGSIEEQMLTAIELFHYSYKFKGKVIVINCTRPERLADMLSDLRVLHSSHVNSLLLLEHSSSLQSLLERANLKGYRFNYLRANPEITDYSLVCSNSWESGQIPVIASTLKSDSLEQRSWSFELANKLKAAKYYYLQDRDGIFGGGKFISYSTSEDLLSALEEIEFNVDNEILRELCFFQARTGIDVGIVAARRGSLFQELFTHRGSGTLISGDYPNLIRPASISDISDIQFLLLPYIRNGTMLPINDERLLEEINEFYVFTVNEAVVASARIKPYGDGCEIAKFCTLPRYQRKGRARQLLIELMKVAKQKGFDYVFLLSLEPAMWSFLSSLGFAEVGYNELPQQWQDQYDSSRGSRAFKFFL